MESQSTPLFWRQLCPVLGRILASTLAVVLLSDFLLLLLLLLLLLIIIIIIITVASELHCRPWCNRCGWLGVKIKPKQRLSVYLSFELLTVARRYRVNSALVRTTVRRAECVLWRLRQEFPEQRNRLPTESETSALWSCWMTGAGTSPLFVVELSLVPVRAPYFCLWWNWA